MTTAMIILSLGMFFANLSKITCDMPNWKNAPKHHHLEG
jgi:hypothetical protein